MLVCVRGTVYIILVTQLEALPPQPSLAPVSNHWSTTTRRWRLALATIRKDCGCIPVGGV